MSPHTQFWIATLASMVITGPLVGLTWRRRLPSRVWTLVYVGVGYGLIVATLVVDSFTNPPLIFHGFFPGVGCGLILIGLGLSARDARSVPGSRR